MPRLPSRSTIADILRGEAGRGEPWREGSREVFIDQEPRHLRDRADFLHGQGPFYRAKLFPPVPDGAGHTIRDYQPAGSAPRLYLPAPVDAVLTDPSIARYLTGGEKKALKANQEGLPCIGLGGLWNWRHEGQPIGDLDRVDWCGWATIVVPDSGVWTRSDLLQPVYALGWGRAGRPSPCSSRPRVLRAARSASTTTSGPALRPHRRRSPGPAPARPQAHAVQPDGGVVEGVGEADMLGGGLWWYGLAADRTPKTDRSGAEKGSVALDDLAAFFLRYLVCATAGRRCGWAPGRWGRGGDAAGEGGRFVEELYEVYAPRVLAGSPG